MVIIKIMGGLGNQMFQGALYRKFETLGVPVKADLNALEKYGNIHNGYELERVFGLQYNQATGKEVRKYANAQLTIAGRIQRRLFGVNKPHHYMETENAYDDKMLGLREGYLEGYWQTERYFRDIKDIILEQYTFPVIDAPDNRCIYEEIAKCESVSIHVRRGDYISDINDKIYGNICTSNYYNNAIAYMKSQVPGIKFFVFSDDIEWVKENLFLDEAKFIDWNKGKESYWDMFLMSKCKHNIIANSTFSWWGAWLNCNRDKIVVAPEQWLNGTSTPDILPLEWVKIKNSE